MRLFVLCLLLGFAASDVAAQIPPGEYLRDFSPGFSGESITILDDSGFVRREWSDVELVGHPSSIYRGESGTVSHAGSELVLTYRQPLLDSLEWQRRSEWSEPVEPWAAARLAASQANRSRLFVGSIEGVPVLTWAEDADSVELCQEALAEPKPDGNMSELEVVLSGLDWHFHRVEACGDVFLPTGLNARLHGGA